jgi:hypothetical protein
MDVEQDVQEIEIHIDEVKKQIKKKDALIALANNPNWKFLIDEGYLKDEAVRLVMLKSSGLQPEQLERVDKMIYGIGAFYFFLQTIIQTGNQAEADLAADEKAREELHAEAMN